MHVEVFLAAFAGQLLAFQSILAIPLAMSGPITWSVTSSPATQPIDTGLARLLAWLSKPTAPVVVFPDSVCTKWQTKLLYGIDTSDSDVTLLKGDQECGNRMDCGAMCASFGCNYFAMMLRYSGPPFVTSFYRVVNLPGKEYMKVVLDEITQDYFRSYSCLDELTTTLAEGSTTTMILPLLTSSTSSSMTTKWSITATNTGHAWLPTISSTVSDEALTTYGGSTTVTTGLTAQELSTTSWSATSLGTLISLIPTIQERSSLPTTWRTSIHSFWSSSPAETTLVSQNGIFADTLGQYCTQWFLCNDCKFPSDKRPPGGLQTIHQLSCGEAYDSARVPSECITSASTYCTPNPKCNYVEIEAHLYADHPQGLGLFIARFYYVENLASVPVAEYESTNTGSFGRIWSFYCVDANISGNTTLQSSTIVTTSNTIVANLTTTVESTADTTPLPIVSASTIAFAATEQSNPTLSLNVTATGRSTVDSSTILQATLTTTPGCKWVWTPYYAVEKDTAKVLLENTQCPVRGSCTDYCKDIEGVMACLVAALSEGAWTHTRIRRSQSKTGVDDLFDDRFYSSDDMYSTYLDCQTETFATATCKPTEKLYHTADKMTGHLLEGDTYCESRGLPSCAQRCSAMPLCNYWELRIKDQVVSFWNIPEILQKNTTWINTQRWYLPKHSYYFDCRPRFPTPIIQQKAGRVVSTLRYLSE